MKTPVAACLAMVLPALAGTARADMPWHAAGWTLRAVVQVAQPGGDGVDVAAVRIRHAGSAAPDANDYRIFDSTGQPVPYEITYHHPDRDTLISFRCSQTSTAFAIYYGNPDAPCDPLRAIAKAPGSGPPEPGPAAAGWIPRTGLVLTTRRRPRTAADPGDVAGMHRLIADSPGPDGAGYRANISDSFNPFGDSSFYLSLYRGWLKIPKSGVYAFCTASSEASFSFLNGRDLAHWPGQHTYARGQHGERNKEITLDAGVHYVEYLHEAVQLYPMAFLGYCPPDGQWVEGKRQFGGIPGQLFPQPHQAAVLRYEREGAQRTVTPAPELMDSAWPTKRSDGQYTRFQFSADPGTEPMDWAGWTIQWNFGDGLTTTGTQVEHVYLRPGDFSVVMTATRPEGQNVRRTWPVTVFPIEHLEGWFRNAAPQDYAKIVATYDVSGIATPSLAEYAQFQREQAQNEIARQAASLVLTRPDSSPGEKAASHLILAGNAGLASGLWSAGGGTPADAGEQLETARRLEPDPVRKLRIMARLIRHVGVTKLDSDQAEAVFDDAKKEARERGLSGRVKTALRDTAIALGDVHLTGLRGPQATEAYLLAEALDTPVIPTEVRVSKSGSYPERIAQHIEQARYEDALTELDKWRDELPSDQVRGTPLFLRGKLAYQRGVYADAAHLLQLAVHLGEGAGFEAEARWWMSQAYKAVGDEGSCRAALQALISSGLAGTWRDKAMETAKNAE